MKDTDLRAEWAWSQIEAMAEGSLRGEERERMRRLMAQDATLGAAVARARRVRGALRDWKPAPVPSGLLSRLWGIPAGADRAWNRPFWGRVGVPFAGVAALAGAVAVFVAVTRIESPEPQPDAVRAAAVEEFRTAMDYLQQGTATAGDRVVRELGGGLRVALDVGRGAVLPGESDADTRFDADPETPAENPSDAPSETPFEIEE